MKKPVFGVRKIKIRIDGVEFQSIEKVPIDPKWVHHKLIHYAKSTKCGLGVTRSIKTAGGMKEVTCPDCLEKHIGFLRRDLAYYEGILDEVKK